MKLACVHYHLERGGVTQVIDNQIRVLQDMDLVEEVVVVHGGRCSGWDPELSFRDVPVPLVEVPGLDYASEWTPAARELGESLHRAVQQLGWSPQTTVFHVHNHAIGKNVGLPAAVQRLRELGYALLLQIHDFAEDLRPVNYQVLQRSLDGRPRDVAPGNWLYPQGDRVQYSVLTGRDRQILERSGLQVVHKLPNPVLAEKVEVDSDTARSRLQRALGRQLSGLYLLYPVRGIRRKNVGEFLLASLLGPAEWCWSMTLPACSAAELPAYRMWKQVAAEAGCPVVFESGLATITSDAARPELGRNRGNLWGESNGETISFAENYAAADAIHTSSVCEGFGMVFLEPWLRGKSLFGRDIAELTSDFRGEGVQLTDLGGGLRVPVGLLPKEPVATALRESYRATWQEFWVAAEKATGCGAANATFATESLEQGLRAIDDWFENELIEFARLPMQTQVDLLRQVATDPGMASELWALNRDYFALPEALSENQPDIVESLGGKIQRNGQVVQTTYGPQVSGWRLSTIYDSLLNSTPKQEAAPVDLRLLLAEFASADLFYEMRVFNPVAF